MTIAREKQDRPWILPSSPSLSGATTNHFSVGSLFTPNGQQGVLQQNAAQIPKDVRLEKRVEVGLFVTVCVFSAVPVMSMRIQLFP